MIVVICGPTGVGKTKLSVELAKKLKGIVVNADSMQVYKELNIGTAKVTEKEKENIPHYLFDIKDPTEMYTIYDYQKDVRKIIEEQKNKNIIMVGGSGLYIKAGLYNYEFAPEEEHNNYEEYTNEELLEMVKVLEPETSIHVNNRKRLVRKLNKKLEGTDKDHLLYDCIFVGLTTNREKLYSRINKRVDQMIEDGLIEEVKKFYDKGIHSKAIMTGIGYKELYQYFANEITLEEAINLIKQRSRQYAKRQYTWFKHQMNMKWFDVNFDDFNQTIEEVYTYIKTKSN